MTAKIALLCVVILGYLFLPQDSATAAPQYFGYYSYDPAQEGTVSFSFGSSGPIRPGLPYIVQSTFDVSRPDLLDAAAIQRWFRSVTDPLVPPLAVWVTDEPELAMPLSAFDASVAKFRAALPGVPLWTNFSTELARFFPGYRPTQDLDIVSVDNNGDTPLDAMPWFKSLLWPHQKILILPPGLRGLTYTDESAMVAQANRMYQYALGDPAVIGLIVFDWPDRHWPDGTGATGVANLPFLRATYAQIGLAIISGVGGGSQPLAAVLPLSRSVQVGGTPATAFAAIINPGSTTAVNCAPAGPSSAPAGLGVLTYQTTTPTNALAGAPNTRANIAPGAIQNYVFGFLPTDVIPETSLAIQFLCDNAAPAPQTPGVNNLFIVADFFPTPDTIALMATISNDGVVRIPAQNGIQVFAISSSNVGSTGVIDVNADTGDVPLPLTLTVCETNTATGACLASPTASVSVTYTGGTNRSFAFFAQASGSIPFDPADRRIFVRLKEAGVLRGATSAAVCTKPNAGC